MANVSSSNGLEKRPKLRFPGFDEPWKSKPFSSLYKYVNEKNDGSFSVDSIISVANMYFKPDARITDMEYLKTYNIFKLGDIAFEGNMSKDFSFGRFVENTIGDGIVSHVFVVFRPINNFHNFDYWKYAINNENVMGRILARCTKKTTMMTNLVTTDFLTQKIYCPSLEEQAHIASFLSLIDQRIRKQKELLNALKKYKRGLISDILKQNLAVSHESEKWEEVSLNDVADGFEYGMNAAATTFDGAHKYIRITDIDDDSHTYIDCDPVSPSGVLEEKYRVRDNDILFARTGASVGKSYLYRKTDGDLFFAGFLIRIHVKDGIDSEYVFLNTLTEEYAKWVLLESARSGQPGINAEQYRRYRFKLPSLRIQKRIASIAQKLDSQIQRESMCLHLLQEQKLGLLQQLFI